LKPFSKHRGGFHRSVLRLAPALLLMLAGCGWEPLYARPSPDPASGGAAAKLATIAIAPVSTITTLDPLSTGQHDPYDSRAAQLLHNNLRDALNPYGPPNPAAYHLAIRLTKELVRTAATGNGDSTREQLVLTARYELTDAKGASVLKDKAVIVNSYDIVREPFIDLGSQNDAVERSVEQLAQQIQTRLATFLR